MRVQLKALLSTCLPSNIFISHTTFAVRSEPAGTAMVAAPFSTGHGERGLQCRFLGATVRELEHVVQRPDLIAIAPGLLRSCLGMSTGSRRPSQGTQSPGLVLSVPSPSPGCLSSCQRATRALSPGSKYQSCHRMTALIP